MSSPSHSTASDLSHFQPETNQFGLTDLVNLESAAERLGLFSRSRLIRFFNRFILNAPMSRSGRLLMRAHPAKFQRRFDVAERAEFLDYLHHLGLSENDLQKAGRIVDIGAGSRYFVGHCVRTGIHSNAYAVEPDIEENPYIQGLSPAARAEVNQHTLKSRLEGLPFKDQSVDLALIHCVHFGSGGCHRSPAISHQSLDSSSVSISGVGAMRLVLENLLDPSFEEVARILKLNGEIRIYPFDPTNEVGGNSSQVLRALETLEASGEFQITFESVPSLKLKHYHEGGRFFRIIIRRIKAGAGK